MTRHKVYFHVNKEEAWKFSLNPTTAYANLFRNQERVTAYSRLSDAIEGGRAARRPSGLTCGQAAEDFAVVRLSYCSELQRALSGMLPDKKTASGQNYIIPANNGTDTRLISIEGMNEIVNHAATHVFIRAYAAQAQPSA